MRLRLVGAVPWRRLSAAAAAAPPFPGLPAAAPFSAIGRRRENEDRVVLARHPTVPADVYAVLGAARAAQGRVPHG